jgi:adenine-specific DNA-methyltransferase
MTVPVSARDLGARGSRGEVAGPDPAGPVPPRAAAVLATVPTWWEALARDAGLSGQWLDVSVAVSSTPPEAAFTGSPDESIDARTPGEVLGASYVAGLAPEVRARHGRHYTPSDLASQLWDMTRHALMSGNHPRAARLPGLVRDRACGAGALLLPPLREHVRASVRSDAEVALAGLQSVIEGIDSDPNAVWLANVVLSAEALPLLAAVPASRRRPLPELVHLGDGLAPCDRLARVEMQNPPYGRVRLTPEERARWRFVLYGHANLYALFIAAALDGLDAEGVLAALVPTSFMSGLYFSRLRETLSKQAPLRDAAFVAERGGVFADVLQETCLAVFTRRRARRMTITSLNGRSESVAQVKSPRGSGPWLLPRRADDAPAAAVAANLPLRLADVGYQCSTGPLVWNRRKPDLVSIQSPGAVPIVWAADIDGGKLHRDKIRDGMRFVKIRDDADELVLVLKSPAILVQRTTAPEQARRLVVADLSAEALQDWGGRLVVENHVNVLRPAIKEPLLKREVLAAVLATDTLDRVTRSLAGSVAVSAYELESLPLPGAPVLSKWNSLSGDQLIETVASAYRA